MDEIVLIFINCRLSRNQRRHHKTRLMLYRAHHWTRLGWCSTTDISAEHSFLIEYRQKYCTLIFAFVTMVSDALHQWKRETHNRNMTNSRCWRTSFFFPVSWLAKHLCIYWATESVCQSAQAHDYVLIFQTNSVFSGKMLTTLHISASVRGDRSK